MSLLAALTMPARANPAKARLLREELKKQKHHFATMSALVRSGLIGSYARIEQHSIEVFFRGRLLRYPNNGIDVRPLGDPQIVCLAKPGEDDHSVPSTYRQPPIRTTTSPMLVALDQGLARIKQAELLLMRGRVNAAEGLLVDARRYDAIFGQERRVHDTLFHTTTH